MEVEQTKEQTKQDIRDQKAKDKAAHDANHKALEENKVAQAEARLKYLLSQSDMFAHFGVGGGSKGSSKSKSSNSSGEPNRYV